MIIFIMTHSCLFFGSYAACSLKSTAVLCICNGQKLSIFLIIFQDIFLYCQSGSTFCMLDVQPFDRNSGNGVLTYVGTTLLLCEVASTQYNDNKLKEASCSVGQQTAAIL